METIVSSYTPSFLASPTAHHVPNMMMISMVLSDNNDCPHPHPLSHHVEPAPSHEITTPMTLSSLGQNEDSNEALSSLPSPLSSPVTTTEDQERKDFMLDLHKFMGEMGKPLSKVPIMGYKELDLFQLFREVVSYGGFNEVVKNVGTWSKIWKRLDNFDPSITDSSFRLKKNYERYLLDYEFKVYPDFRRSTSLSDPKPTTTLKRSASQNNINISSPFQNNNNNEAPTGVRLSKTPKTKKLSSNKNRSSSLTSSTESFASSSLLNSSSSCKEILPEDESNDVSGPSTVLKNSVSFDSSWNDQLPYFSGRSQRSAKKRKINYSVDSSSEDEDYENENDYYPNQTVAASTVTTTTSKQSKTKNTYSSEEDSSSSLSFTDNLFVNMSRDEIDALENAVLTLSTLKYCSAC